MEIIDFEFNKDIGNNIKKQGIVNYPIVYIISNEKKVYIGETTNASRRLTDHQRNSERKQLKEVRLILDNTFNQSATYNIETNLINYFIGDEKYIIQNKSQTKQKIMHNYYNKPYYDKELFGKIWSELHKIKLVNSSIIEIENKDIFKLSPFKTLSEGQNELKQEIIKYCNDNINLNTKKVFAVNGEAGTGKSVLISSLYNELQDLSKEKNSNMYQSNNYLLVNHNEMLKSYHKLTKTLLNMKKNKIMRPTSFINTVKEKANVVIIDEAHLLLSSPDKFNGFSGENQLLEIIKKSEIVILIFDVKQYLKVESYWEEKQLEQIIKNSNSDYTKKNLKEQLRMTANSETIKWIDDFVGKKIGKIPHDDTFELKVFESAKTMHKVIKEKNKEFGLSRIVSTFDFEHKKDGKQEYCVETGDFKLPWNKEIVNKAWAEEETVDEVGSIYTIQGFDLNYVGVILGPSVSYNEEKDELEINVSKYKDTKAMMVPKNKKNLKNIDKIKEQIILNSINILLKRGVKGLYIYAHDEKLRKKLNHI